jgi:hypothetical protein
LTPQPLVVDTYVVEQQQQAAAAAGAAGSSSSSSSSSSGGQLVSMFSFYTLPSSIIRHPEHNELRAAYMFYTGMCSCSLAIYPCMAP